MKMYFMFFFFFFFHFFSTVSAPADQRRKSLKNMSQKPTESPTHVDGYSSKHLQQPIQINKGLEPIKNTTTIPDQEKPSTKTKRNVVAKPRSRSNSYAEAAALRKNSKMLSSPEHDPVSKKPFRNHSRQPSNTLLSDVELTPEVTVPSHSRAKSDSSFSSPPFQTSNKSSPQKPANSLLKSNRQSLSPISSSHGSAPVYRPAPEIPNQDDSLVELEPHPNPESAIKEILEDLASGTEQWERKCMGLLTVRRLAAYNREVLVPQLQPVVNAVNQEV